MVKNSHPPHIHLLQITKYRIDVTKVYFCHVYPDCDSRRTTFIYAAICMYVYQGISDCFCRACPVFSQLFLLLLLFQRMSRKPKREHVKSTLSTCMSGMLLSENYMQCIYFTVSVYIPKKINIFFLN